MSIYEITLALEKITSKLDTIIYLLEQQTPGYNDVGNPTVNDFETYDFGGYKFDPNFTNNDTSILSTSSSLNGLSNPNDKIKG